jgi:hypothetical protein
MPIQTVGELIERLGEFDPDAPVRMQHGFAAGPEFIMNVGPIPDMPGTVAIIYMPPRTDDFGI